MNGSTFVIHKVILIKIKANVNVNTAKYISKRPYLPEEQRHVIYFEGTPIHVYMGNKKNL